MAPDPIRSAQALAIQRLTEILRTSDDPVQIRLTSELLLRLTPEEGPLAAPAAATPVVPALAPHDSTPEPTEPPAHSGPLTANELIALRQLLPAVRPERFHKRAAHWRAVLAQFGRSPPLTRAPAA